MDCNKDEALRCVSLAREAISLRDKKTALKFIKIAQRLNTSLVDDELLAACEGIGSGLESSVKNVVSARKVGGGGDTAKEGVVKKEGVSKGYTEEEHVRVIREIRSKRDYYEILGVEKGCLVEEIKRGYKNLSLMVHPDRNKAPGSAEAFKKVGKAFECLREESSRREYDEMGLVDEVEYDHGNNVRRRRGTGGEASFGQGDKLSTTHVNRRRATGTNYRDDVGDTICGGVVLLIILVIILIFFIPTYELEYSLQKSYTYQLSKMTEEYGIVFFVKSPDFDEVYPIGTPARDKIENSVIKDYKKLLTRHCHVELQRRQQKRNVPTPNCDELRDFGVA